MDDMMHDEVRPRIQQRLLIIRIHAGDTFAGGGMHSLRLDLHIELEVVVQILGLAGPLGHDLVELRYVGRWGSVSTMGRRDAALSRVVRGGMSSPCSVGDGVSARAHARMSVD